MADRRITGYAAVFAPELSEDLGGFRELVMPGAFDRALREKHDVRALVGHNPNLILGRTKAGTLRLKVDARGLLAEIDAPDTTAGRDVLESIDRGDVDGMSFAFVVVKEDWREARGELVREVIDLELRDVSIVTYPAYPAAGMRAAAPAGGVPLEILKARLRMSEA